MYYAFLQGGAFGTSPDKNELRLHRTFELSIIQENKWEVGQALEATLLIPLTIPPLGYGWIYYLLSRPLKNHKQYEIIINDYLAYNCMDFFSMMSMSFGGQGPWV